MGRRRFIEPPKLDFGTEDGKNLLVNSLVYLAAANIVIWVGLFLYLWRVDRRLSEREGRQ